MSNAPWGTRRGAVSLTFDDGTPDQIAKAVPILERSGLRGTFYLQPHGDRWRERLEPWRAVADAGHEMGNHSLTHPCSDAISGRPGGLEELSIDEYEADILAAQERLDSVFPGRADWTFAYPCYNTFVGRGVDRQSTVPIVARHFLAGRGGGELGFGNAPGLVDLACVWGQAVEGRGAAAMIELVDSLAARGQWLVLVFHTIDDGRLMVAGSELEPLVEHLARRQDEIWTAPLVEVARAVRAWQAGAERSTGQV